MHRLSMLLALPLPLALGCYPEVIDEDQVCVSIEENADQYRLFVEAESGDHCARDHRGASLECTITMDGQLVLIETVFQDGKDPNDGCAGPLQTTCEVDLEAGTYTVEYADKQYGYHVPGGERFCIAGRGPGE